MHTEILYNKCVKEVLESIDKPICIITDSHVGALYKFSFPTLCFPAGERNKARAIKEQLEDALFEKGFGRDLCLIALGGGVTTDLVGFIAATFCRGVELINIPTSLMGMIDAAIGGKNGVNSPFGKNMIGTLYHPAKLVINPQFLETLPEKEWQNGQGEVLKYALLTGDDLMQMEPQALIRACIETKLRMIGDGVRDLLNFGHTVAHAIEKVSEYSIPHGEAVMLGCKVEAALTGIAVDEVQGEIPYCPSELLTAMNYDKKGAKKFVALREVGTPYRELKTYPDDHIIKTLEETICAPSTHRT
ncbi:MAG: 3-dehydroquinate synthase [Simkaniaceae bacterium]|nr:3-dehydroquinate synthase [Simkaniaceae bacterium]